MKTSSKTQPLDSKLKNFIETAAQLSIIKSHKYVNYVDMPLQDNGNTLSLKAVIPSNHSLFLIFKFDFLQIPDEKFMFIFLNFEVFDDMNNRYCRYLNFSSLSYCVVGLVPPLCPTAKKLYVYPKDIRCDSQIFADYVIRIEKIRLDKSLDDEEKDNLLNRIYEEERSLPLRQPNCFEYIDYIKSWKYSLRLQNLLKEPYSIMKLPIKDKAFCRSGFLWIDEIIKYPYAIAFRTSKKTSLHRKLYKINNMSTRYELYSDLSNHDVMLIENPRLFGYDALYYILLDDDTKDMNLALDKNLTKHIKIRNLTSGLLHNLSCFSERRFIGIWVSYAAGLGVFTTSLLPYNAAAVLHTAFIYGYCNTSI